MKLHSILSKAFSRSILSVMSLLLLLEVDMVCMISCVKMTLLLAPNSVTVASVDGGEMKEIGVAVAEEGPFDARLHAYNSSSSRRI